MASNWIIRKDVELTRIRGVDQLTNVGHIFKADNQAHVWEAHIYQDGQPVTLTGYGVRGYFIRSDGSTIAVSGSASGNVASVTFNNSCYAHSGLLKGALRLEKTNEIITVAALYAVVDVAATDNVVINTETEPDVEEILAELDEAITNAQAAASELSTAIEDKAVIYTGAQNLTEAQKEQARENIGATAGAVRYDAAQTLTDAQKSTARGNIGALATNQGAANEGFAMVVGPGGNVVPAEAGLSEATKTALLNIFQHVAYTDAQGQTYYDALYAALYASAYPRIGATFDPGSNTIYVDEGLNALKQYMVVKVYEDAEDTGTVVPSTDYTLTGTLSDGENTVVVGYDGMVTSVQVEAVDFYNRMTVSTADGTLVKLAGSVDVGQNDTQKYPSRVRLLLPYESRRTYCQTRGKAQYYDYNGTNVGTGYYPTPVPAAATHVAISMIPDGQYVYAQIVSLDESAGQYGNSLYQSGWTQFTNNRMEFDLPAATNRYLVFNTKYDSAGQSYPVEPQSVTVEFTAEV